MMKAELRCRSTGWCN